MKFYLAARYSRRLELCGYRDALQSLGQEVQAQWLDGSHQISDSGAPIGEHGESLVEGDSGADSPEAAQLRAQFAEDDLRDVVAANCFVAFTEPPRSGSSRGGRHVELGMAIALRRSYWRGKPSRIIVIGHRENLFCWLPEIEFYETWNAFIEEFCTAVTE